MRPYRGKTKEGKWVKGWYFADNEKHYICLSKDEREYLSHRFFEVLPETVAQSTGRKDINDKEIFEGNVVKGLWQVDKHTTVTGIVKYYPEYCLYALEDKDENMVSVVWEFCEIIHDKEQ